MAPTRLRALPRRLFANLFRGGPGGRLEGAMLGVIAALALVAADDGGEFIYFQF